VVGTRNVGGRISANVTIELENWHPTPRRDVNRSNYYDVAALDTAWPNVPQLLAIGSLGVQLTTLEKCIHRSPNSLGEFGNGD